MHRPVILFACNQQELSNCSGIHAVLKLLLAAFLLLW